MAKYRKFYKGRRKPISIAWLPVAISLVIIAVIVVMFYSLQKYAVITKEGVDTVLPFLDNNAGTDTETSGSNTKSFEDVDAQVVFKDQDFDSYQAVAGKNAGEMRAIFIPSDELSRVKILECAQRLTTGNALVLEMKGRDGILRWNTLSSLAYNYGLSTPTSMTEEIEQAISEVVESDFMDVHMVAQISCCIDSLLPSRCTTVSIRNYMGYNYADDSGQYLDPYNREVREYICQLIQELYDMGFDEVVLADVVHPVLEDEDEEKNTVYYTVELSTTQDSVNAVCGLAAYIADKFSDRGSDKLLSIYVNRAQALAKTDKGTGQSAPFFLKIYDRVYYYTDKYTYTYNYQDIEPNVTVGSPKNRFIPVVENYLPDNTSWAYIDTITEDD